MRHPIRGLLIGPLVAPIAVWIAGTVFAWHVDISFSWTRFWRELALSTAEGLPITYAATLVWGAPVLFALRRIGWLRAWTLVPAGAVGGALIGAWVAYQQQGASYFQVRMPVPAGTVLGALVAGACWWAGQGQSNVRSDLDP